MGKRLIVIVGVIACLAVSAAPAQARSILDSYCSPTGDYCTAIKDKGGPIRLLIGGFPFRGSYKLCVDPPNLRKDCDNFNFKKAAHGLRTGDVSLGGHFPSKPRGRYSVTWYWDGYKLGPTLHFNR